MAANPFRPVLRSIRKSLGITSQSADVLLLERFVLADDESAFAALVERHGAMVWGVCRRVAGDAHVAEDAFQATWIVLARKADSLKDGGSLPGWLHRVAFRLALATRGRPTTPLEDIPVNAPGPEDDAANKEVRQVIDEEVERLPQKYRLPVVLCFYEGRTHAEAAGELGWPVGTVAGRLARAKEMLHARLTRRGLAPTVWPLPGLAVAAFPPVAGKAAGSAAVALAAALLAGESKRRLAVGGAILLLSLFGLVAGVVAFQAIRPDDVRNRPDPTSVPFRIAPVKDEPVAFGPGGDRVATWRDGAVRLFDVRTNREVAALPAGWMGAPRMLQFSPDGGLLAAGGEKGLAAWNLETRQLLVWQQTEAIGGATFSQDGRLLAWHHGQGTALGVDGRSTVTQAWDLRAGKSLGSFSGAVVWLSPDGKTLVTRGGDNFVRFWEVSSGKELRKVPWTRFTTFHPDNRTFAAVGYDGIIRLHDGKTGNEAATLNPHVAVYNDHSVVDKETITRIGEYYATLSEKAGLRGGSQGDVDLRADMEDILSNYRAALKKKPWALHLRPPVFNPDGTTLASSYGMETHLWNVRRGTFLVNLEGSPWSFSPDGKMFATTSGEWTLLWDWDVGNRNLLARLNGSPTSFSPNGRTLATTKGLWDVASQRRIAPLDDVRVLFWPDSDAFFAHSGDAISLYDARTGNER